MRLDRLIFETASLLPLGGTDGIRVLCYHGVYDPGQPSSSDRYAVSAAQLEAHLARIGEVGLRVISPAELERCETDAVLLTFDDNLPSHLDWAVPTLEAAGVTASFYLSPGELGAPGKLSYHGLRALLDHGMFIGAHGNRHIPAIRLSPFEFLQDVKACRDFLRGLAMPLTWAYPGGYVGSYGRVHDRILLDEGFTVRFSTLEGVCQPSPRRVQPRYVIRQHSSLRYVSAALRGGLQLVSLAKRAGALARGRVD